ncbi:uncharacterized protein [Rhodnius prolixus]|uniref:uncharacterized protein n=1 Tax=Rhodnius prolixus TaxID=13249 RepID=UPI003D18A412
MRNKVSIVIVLMMALEATQALVCTNNYCQIVKCPVELTEETCNGHFIPRSSRCGCCSTCVSYIKPFSYCDEINESSEPENFFKHECPTGYVCALHRCSPLIH